MPSSSTSGLRFIHVVACIRGTFLSTFLPELNPYMDVPHIVDLLTSSWDI